MKWRGPWCSWEEGMGRRIKWELAVHPFLPTPLTPSTGCRIRIRFLKLWSSLVQHSWISITYWTWASVSFIITASRYHLTQDIMSLADFHPLPTPLPPPLTQSLPQVQFSCSVASDSLWSHGLQHVRLPCPSPAPGACSYSCPSSGWCHPCLVLFNTFLMVWRLLLGQRFCDVLGGFYLIILLLTLCPDTTLCRSELQFFLTNHTW